MATTHDAAKATTIHYRVNAESQQTDDHKLSGRQILERAGFAPASEYRLTREHGDKEIELDDVEPIHEGEVFLATFRGPTPVS